MKYFLVCCMMVTSLWANPENPVVVSGEVSFGGNGQLLEVTASNRAVVEWERFSIGSAETVRFLQPSSTATVLNRVTGIDVSTLSGRLESNGVVYLINPRGVIVSAGAVVDTAGFLATTLDVENGQFLGGGDVLFTGDSDGSVVQQGVIRARDGNIVLMAHCVRHEGKLTAENGSVSLVAGHEVLLKPEGMPLLTIKPDLRALSVENLGSIEALNAYVLSDGMHNLGALRQEGDISLVQSNGKILLSSSGVAEIGQAAKLTAPEGSISVAAGEFPLYNKGTFDVSGVNGGTIAITGEKFANGGTLLAEGHGAVGGLIQLDIGQMFVEVAAGRMSANGTAGGGTISVKAPSVFSSGTHSGGNVEWLGTKVTSAGASITADDIVLGGKTTPADEVYISRSTTLSGNNITILANETLHDLTSSVTPFPQTPLIDPTAALGTDSFGQIVITLPVNGNIVVTKPFDNFGGMHAGAFFLYNGQTTKLMSSYFGSSPSDEVGSSTGVIVGGSNFAVVSPFWSGTATDAGAVTWVSGTSMVLGGIVSPANSLVGSSVGDFVGNRFNILTNGNYVTGSMLWSIPMGAAAVGAVAWADGQTGITGTISAANSLIGTTANDGIGSNFAIPLTNGNYVVGSSNWNNPVGAVSTVGAATWGNGITGVTGTVSASNSLIGSHAMDQVSLNGITVLSNGTYVVNSTNWQNGLVAAAGASTWGNGNIMGVTGTVSVANSLVGTHASDQVGFAAIALTTNYVVESFFWGDGVHTQVGAATWGSSATGVTGTVSIANSLIGSTTNDQVGHSAAALTGNGNYVVNSLVWQSGGNILGAATWSSGNPGITGTVSATNSLIGSSAQDFQSSQIFPLTNGNYVVSTPEWDNVGAGAINAGAVTWGSGAGGVTGTISASKSLIGTTGTDLVGANPGVITLVNGNYVVGSSNWNNPVGAVNVGAATWGNGSSGTTGTVSESNSLIGTLMGDAVSNLQILPLLINGNYVVVSVNWNSNLGAATWGNGATGITGTVSATNSLIGSTPGNSGDFVGDSEAAALVNGNYVVGSDLWNDPVNNIVGVGAATWANGTTGITGTVSAANSLIGTTANDAVSTNGIIAFSDGHYVVVSGVWNSPSFMSAGAATYGDGTSGTTGTVSIANSVVGLSANSGLNGVHNNPAVPGTFVVQFLNTPAVIVGGIVTTPPTPPSPTPSPSGPSAAVTAAARIQFRRALAESFEDWNDDLFGPYLSDDPWAPIYTAKGLLVNLPSLVLREPWQPHTLLLMR